MTKVLPASSDCSGRAQVQPKCRPGSHTGVDTPGQPLSEYARVILERMDPDRVYGAEDLQEFLPDAGLERLREIMHELWIERQVERVGYAAWRRVPSAPPHRSGTVSRQAQAVRPEELFDHDTFADFFK